MYAAAAPSQNAPSVTAKISVATVLGGVGGCHLGCSAADSAVGSSTAVLRSDTVAIVRPAFSSTHSTLTLILPLGERQQCGGGPLLHSVNLSFSNCGEYLPRGGAGYVGRRRAACRSDPSCPV